MRPLFQEPELDLHDSEVIDELTTMRHDLQQRVRVPRRWTGGLRRTATARAIRGSNTIEGYTVSDEDALAAVDDEEPLSADERTWVEILGYRRVLTFILNVATGPGFVPDLATLNALHFMLLEHDLQKGPGQLRPGPVYVHDDRADTVVYEGPEAAVVPELMAELAHTLREPSTSDPLVRAAMAHLNLVMIHPYRDGNGRMARALQTMVLAQDVVLEPAFASIEEWLGNNSTDYYDVLAAVGRGGWQPENDASLWVKFNLRAHHLQAQTLARRFAEAEDLYLRIDQVISTRRLPERVADPLFDALLGTRVTRPLYLRRVEGLDQRTATRDLARLVELGLLEPHGQTRGRYYTAAGDLAEARRVLRGERRRLDDPYPALTDDVRRARRLI